MHTLIIDCTAFLLHLAVYALDADGEVYQKEYTQTYQHKCEIIVSALTFLVI